MSLQIQMLGTGYAFTKKYYNNNALIYANGYKLLIDCGVTAPRSLFDLQIPLREIDAILITHIHADHVGGLEEFAFQLMYGSNSKIKLFLPETIAVPLWEHSLKGGLENAAEGITRLEDYFDVAVLQPGTSAELHEGLRIELIPAKHIPNKPSYSVLLNEYIFYSSDSVFDRQLLEDLHGKRNCKYILHDCQLTSPGIVHASLDELLTLPEDIQEKVHLMHYGDNKEQFVGRTGKMQFLEQHRIYHFPE